MCFLGSDIVCFQTVTIIHYVTNGPGSIPEKYTNKEIAKINVYIYIYMYALWQVYIEFNYHTM